MKAKNKKSDYCPLQDVAVCEKHHDGTVIFQTPESQQLCGPKVGKKCHDCETDDTYIGQSQPISTDKIYYQDDIYSRIRINKSDSSATIMVKEQTPHFNIHALITQSNLSQREEEIAQLIINRKSNPEIQNLLVISESTLKSHINHIYQKVPSLKELRRHFHQ